MIVRRRVFRFLIELLGYGDDQGLGDLTCLRIEARVEAMDPVTE